MNRNLIERRWRELTEPAVRRRQAERLRQYLQTVVLPFSAHYRKLFAEHGLEAKDIRSIEDLARVPFTTKADLQNTPANQKRARDFIVVPDLKVLARRPLTILHTL